MLKKINKTFFSVVLATMFAHAQDVSVMVGDTSFAGYTDDIVVPVMLSNPNSTVGGIQFDVSVEPSMVMMSGVTPVGIGTGFSADYSSLNNGNSRVVFYMLVEPWDLGRVSFLLSIILVCICFI